MTGIILKELWNLMNKNFSTATRTFLEPAELSERNLEAVIGDLMSGSGIDYADVYFQHSRHESWQLDEGCVKSGSYNIDQGVGLRATAGEKTAFAYTDNLELPALLEATRAARSIVRQGGSVSHKLTWDKRQVTPLYNADNPIVSLDDTKKVELLQYVDQVARSADPRVEEVTTALSGVFEVILVLTSDGRMVPDVRPLVRLNVSVIVEQNGKRERGSSGGGGRTDYSIFTRELAADYAREAVRQATTNLDAVNSPAGTMPVVLGPGWPGVLLHEAVGHGLEGDFNRKGTSAFTGRIGEMVASPLCTIVDDGTLAGRRGSLSVDDEGNETRQNILIEDGVLKGYMQDNLNSRLMGVAPTGNGRRESFAHLPMPRMTNTYMMAGDSEPEDIIASVDKGLYAVNFGGGQVDITSGQFVFSTSEAYLIENGKVTSPVRGATLIGSGPETMTRISMVGNDMKLDSGVGVCGKDGQSVPVGVGQPTLKIDALTVGGVQA
jgi:TldD protein